MHLYNVSVRELCEFGAKVGDLDHRFTPSPSALEGITGHQTVALRRGPGRRSEVSLVGEHKQLRVRGRADGYIESDGVLEEVKTHRGSVESIPANRRALHLAQAKVYAALLCRQLVLPSIQVAIVYYEITRQEETVIVENCSAVSLQAFFEHLCDRFVGWAMQELEHRRARDLSLHALRFVHDTFRTGQRELAANVFHAARSGRPLMAQAPTGIGKTLGTLFPLLKAAGPAPLDRIFFLTAKTSGQSAATEALRAIRRANPGMQLRALEMVARDRACEHPGNSCQGDSCPLARGFYDRLPAARAAAVALDGDLHREAVRRVAREHGSCPYYLTQELVRWSDVVVADYNYFFDSSAMLHALALANEWNVAVVVDEAHNLLERARSMYSAHLTSQSLDAACEAAPHAIRPAFQRLKEAWPRVSSAVTAGYEVLAEIPEELASSIGRLTGAVTDLLANEPVAVGETTLRFYFDCLHFARMVESFGQHSLFDVTLGTAGVDLCIRNVVPARFLKPRFAATKTTILCSATLTPQPFYAETLGLAADTAWLDVESPFAAEQLEVRIVSSVSTRFRHRAQSCEPVAKVVADQWGRRPGNYLAFFSSFDYLEQVASTFRVRYPHIPAWSQERGGSEASRRAFLDNFRHDGSGIGFAVLGGSFGEGVDLPGTRLIGAFVATLGMPQVNAVNEEVCRRQEELFSAGHDYTYLYPGLRKVVQAAGRVIRTASDSGTLVLIDDRFDRPEVRALLPSWWHVPVSARSRQRREGVAHDEISPGAPSQRAGHRA